MSDMHAPRSMRCYEVVRVQEVTRTRTVVDSADSALLAIDRCDAARLDGRRVRPGNQDTYYVDHPRPSAETQCGNREGRH